MKSLYETLRDLEGPPVDAAPSDESSRGYEHLTGKAFADAILNSEEFRSYITEGLKQRTLPSAILCRVMDHGWGKPPDRIEHTGKDGAPIVTEVRRVIVRTANVEHNDDDTIEQDSYTTH
jgi:hypothetical protein